MGDRPKVVITRKLPGVSLSRIGEKAEAVLSDRDGPMRPDRRGARPMRTHSGTVRACNEAGGDAAVLECRDLPGMEPGRPAPLPRLLRPWRPIARVPATGDP
ncbi:MAG TPA: hypothetical protein VJ307_00340, partial [Candidatus Deferrimicrobiaceae bacterium]|nr:hypothetical protein [Candidatus Deferrimicrobiaceae bacterium]